MEEPPFDEALAEGVRVSDPDALSALVRWLRSQVCDHHVAEDLAEETFLDLVRARGAITGNAFQIRGWLFRAAQRNLLDHRRRLERRPEECVAQLPDRACATPGPQEEAEAGEASAHMRAALAHLTGEQREVLTLRFLTDLSAPEVAQLLGMTEGGVRALQHRGLAALARVLRSGAVPIHLSLAGEPT